MARMEDIIDSNSSLGPYNINIDSKEEREIIFDN